MKSLLKNHTWYLIGIVQLSFLTTDVYSAVKIIDSDRVKISIIYLEAEQGDQLLLNISTHTPITNLAVTNEFKESVVNAKAKGVYEFDIRMTPAQEKAGLYISVCDAHNGLTINQTSLKKTLYTSFDLLKNYFVQSGDSLIVTVHRKKRFGFGSAASENFQIEFKGIGALKYQLRSQIDSAKYQKTVCDNYFNRDSTYNTWNEDLMTAHELASTIAKFAGQLDPQAYEELKIHAVFNTKASESLLIRTALREHFGKASTKVKSKLAERIDRCDTLQWSSFDPAYLLNSYDFWAAELEKYHAISYLQTGTAMPDSIITVLRDIQNPIIRERLVILSANYYSGTIIDYQKFLKSASRYVRSTEGKRQLNTLGKITIGQPAFNFNLMDIKGNHVNLSQFKGKVVFMDFWYTGCLNCTKYYTSVLSKIEEQFRSRPDVVFLTISIDRSREQWIKSVIAEKYTSTTSTNLYTNGQGMSNEVIEYYGVHDFPRTLIIDKGQKIFQMGDVLRDSQKLIDALNLADK